MLEELRRDLAAALERDPAARSRLEIVLCYPGLWAVWSHRLTHRLWQARLRLLARLLSQLTRTLTGIEIHPAAQLGPGLFIDHGMGVVIGETAEVGADVTLYHGVTLGGVSLEHGKRHPTLGERVVVGAGAKVLGPIQVGAGSRIGANAVVVKPVPPDSVVVGVPGEIVARRERRLDPDLDHGQLPDVLGDTLADLMTRVRELEEHLHAPSTHEAPYTSEEGVWHETEDYSI